MIWTKGSPISSMTVRSNSVSAPVITKSTCLPALRVRSLTSRGKREKTCSTATILVCKTSSCNRKRRRFKVSTLSSNSRFCNSELICSSRPRLITNSATRFINSSSLRVDIRKLDELMNLVAELVINRGRLEQISSELQHQELEESVETLNRLLLRLQDDVLKTRMVAVEHVFSRFPRLIRDLAHRAGKQVDLQITGADTELDRTVIDEIGDPLVHIIRNSVDHGIEQPEERKAGGKTATGRLSVNAHQAGNQVVITVVDDGKGIESTKIADTALAKGYVTPEQLEEMSEEEIINLVFLPGFSTSEEVTDVSGRGVGMDVVRERISALGGQVQLSSVPGEGTTVTIQLPLTLAIIQTLMVQIGSEIYAIPTSLVDQTISVDRKDIKKLRRQEVTMLRGEVLPLRSEERRVGKECRSRWVT